jgi:hypothetical protein
MPVGFPRLSDGAAYEKTIFPPADPSRSLTQKWPFLGHAQRRAMPREPRMAFRSDDQDYRWRSAGHGRDDRQGRAGHDREVSSDSLSLQDTLRELAVTVVGFIGVVVLITALVSAFHG